MKYETPEVIALGPATIAVQGPNKTEGGSDAGPQTHDTSAAYEDWE